jgi:hypothetical protein
MRSREEQGECEVCQVANMRASVGREEDGKRGRAGDRRMVRRKAMTMPAVWCTGQNRTGQGRGGR